MKFPKVLNSLPRRFEDLRHRNKGGKATSQHDSPQEAFSINANSSSTSDSYGVVEPWLEKATNDHKPRQPLDSINQNPENEIADSDSHREAYQKSGSALSPIDEHRSQMIGENITESDGKPSQSHAFQLRLPPTHFQGNKYAESDTDTPNSQAVHPLESELSSGTVIVNHHAQPSLTFTASIEDYAAKADPKNWRPAKFKKGQSVRIRPGTYAVPYKKFSESKHNYTQLGSYTRGTIHMLNKETSTMDPREFVIDEREVLYRIWIPAKVNRTVEFIFAAEEDLQVFTECVACTGFATEKCGGCNKAYYCSDYCLATDWKNHKAQCNHKGKAHPPLGGSSSAQSDGSSTVNSDGFKNKQAPVRKFRDDGTVKIRNGYQPPPELTKGRMMIMPKCLRPLTLEEQYAPEPAYFVLRVARRQSHKLRQRIHKNRMPETLNEEKKYVYAEGGSKGTPDDGVLYSNEELPYSVGKSPLGRNSRMGYHDDAARNGSLESDLPIENSEQNGNTHGDEEQPSSGKSAESVQEGGPPKNRPLFGRYFFARTHRTSHDASKPITEKETDMNANDKADNKASTSAEASNSADKSRVSFSEKVKKRFGGKQGNHSAQTSPKQETRKGNLRPMVKA